LLTYHPAQEIKGLFRENPAKVRFVEHTHRGVWMTQWL
jgi:hypothetical protein